MQPHGVPTPMHLAAPDPPSAAGQAAPRPARPTAPGFSDAHPRTTWRARAASWSTLEWEELHAALPTARAIEFTDAYGIGHPFDGCIALDWPEPGALTTALRTHWSGRAVAAGPVGLMRSPAEIALAFRETLAESRLGLPASWDVCTTLHGEWWAYRARYAASDCRGVAAGPACCALTLYHHVGPGLLSVQAGWMRHDTAAEILSGTCRARLAHRRIAPARGTGLQLIDGFAADLDRAGMLLGSWNHESVRRSTLTAWASGLVTPRLGETAAATLVARYDRRRFSTQVAPESRPARLDTVRDVAWALAAIPTEITDIERRSAFQSEILDCVRDLPFWNSPAEPGNAPSSWTH